MKSIHILKLIPEFRDQQFDNVHAFIESVEEGVNLYF